MRRKQIWWIVPAVIILGAAVWSQIVSSVEHPKYMVVQSQGNIQIRDYGPMIVAETEVSGDRKEAISQGFRIIADYIFGNNTSKKNVAMTAPVVQQKNEKISMTAPVTQEDDAGQWKVRFVMPARYTMITLPKPKNDAVKLLEIAGKRYAVNRFSGIARDGVLREHTEELNKFILENKIDSLSKPSYAFFNPPWTLPFLRRNEIMIEIASQ